GETSTEVRLTGATEPGEQRWRRHAPEGLHEQPFDLSGFGAGIQVHAEPAPMSYVGRTEVCTWVTRHESLLRTLRRRAPEMRPRDGVMGGVIRGELPLAANEPGGVTMAGSLLHCREGEADRPHEVLGRVHAASLRRWLVAAPSRRSRRYG